jgi:SAM-dependent methyltransferase
MTADTTSRTFFDRMYQVDIDPWKFASSHYELERYRAILEALPLARYRHGFEPGCSVGVLTEQLASKCDAVDAIDISPLAVERVRQRCSDLRNVDIQCGALPTDIPAGEFDLIVFSEIGYYFESRQLRSLAAELLSHMSRGGTFLSAHWLGSSPDHILSGDQVHEVILGIEELSLEYSEKHAGFRLDRWVCR